MSNLKALSNIGLDQVDEFRKSVSSNRSYTLSSALNRGSTMTKKTQMNKFTQYERELNKQNQALGEETEAQNKKVIKHLSTLIKRNKSLIHLDLSQTQLTEYMLWKIGVCLSRAKSLASIHLSGNQGVTPTLKELLAERIRSLPK